MSVTVRAAAKINLHLGVGAPREDGFHPLDTVYQAISLYDDVTVAEADADEVTLDAVDHVTAADVPLDASNIALRALAESSCGSRHRVRIAKAIPVAGGMAGGSADGAAIRDMLKVLGRRYRSAHIVIRSTRVQGDGSSADVAEAIRAIQRVPGVDVLIVGRGGGSIEDLWAFNEEAVARAIAAAPVPVISAVGHESDVTVADLVADVRAPTPSAAAEIVVAGEDEFYGRIDRTRRRLDAAARARL